MIEQDSFGRLPDGREIQRFTLTNRNGLIARLITYGATLTELHVPDKDGHLEDVVLGHSRLEDYVNGRDYFGAVIGRVCGRITNSHIEIDGKRYGLVANAPPHHLHGGLSGFDKEVWQYVDHTEDTLRLRHVSPHGRSGYPGEVDVLVSFRLTDRNEFMIRFRAETDRPTPLSLSQQNFFNLGGHADNGIQDHLLTIFAEHLVPCDKEMTLSDRKENVHGTPADFNRQRRIGDVLDKLWMGHGDLYVVRRTRHGDFVPAARLEHPRSGRVLDIATTEDCLQFYTGKYIHSRQPGKHGKPYPPHAGLCLNCHGYPNAANSPDFANIILRPGQTYRHQTVLAFRVAETDR